MAPRTVPPLIARRGRRRCTLACESFAQRFRDHDLPARTHKVTFSVPKFAAVDSLALEVEDPLAALIDDVAHNGRVLSFHGPDARPAIPSGAGRLHVHRVLRPIHQRD